MRPTLIDVARQARVSPATVDRVLNNRPGVRIRTRQVVLETAQRLGYIADGARPAADPSVLRLDFVLPMGTNSFIKTLRDQIETQASLRPDLDARVHLIEGFNPDTLARALLDLQDKAQGIGIVALDHPTVREAIRTLSSKGVKVLTMVSDILHVPRIAYVGIDNRQAGRLAGYLVGRLLGPRNKGKVALLAGSLSYRGHEEREMGFRHILAEEFPNLEIVELREVRDDQERAFVESGSLLDRYEDLAGIYNIGAGLLGIAQALKERRREHSVIFVGHEATEASKPLLLDGTLDAVIDQNPRVEARESLNILSRSLRDLPYEPHQPRLQIVFRENIPEV